MTQILLSPKTYQLSPQVYPLKQDGLTQLLDFRRGQFYGLDWMASNMLDLVLDRGVEATITEISETYDTSKEEVKQDLNQLLEQLVSQKLIIPLNHSPKTSTLSSLLPIIQVPSLKFLKLLFYGLRQGFNPQTEPNSLTVNTLLILSWLSFRLLGWRRTLNLWQQWHPPQGKIEVNQVSDILQTIDQLVRKSASSQLFLAVVCKERALVGYHLLKTFYGLPATLVIGIDPYPLQIHAWVEYEGVIITDNPEHCQLFSPLVHYT